MRWAVVAWSVFAITALIAYAIWTDSLRHAILNLRPLVAAALRS